MKSFTSGRYPPLAACCRLAVAALLSLHLSSPAIAPGTAAALGRALFFDVNLSATRTQSCATCHDPVAGFHDSRDNGVNGAASLGGDGRSLGDRNAPSVAYAAPAPAFHRDPDAHYRGGPSPGPRAGRVAHCPVLTNK